MPRRRIVHVAFVSAFGLPLRHAPIAIVGTYGQRSCLRHHVGSGVGVQQGIDVGGDAARHALHASIVFQHDVQYGLHPFGILFGPRGCDDLDASHHRCRHGAQDFLRILRERRVGAPVLVDAEGRTSLHQDIVVAVHCHVRHLPKHIQYAQRTAILVGGNVVTNAVHILPHQLPLRRNGDVLHPGLQCHAVACFSLRRVVLLSLCLCPCPQARQGHEADCQQILHVVALLVCGAKLRLRSAKAKNIG